MALRKRRGEALPPSAWPPGPGFQMARFRTFWSWGSRRDCDCTPPRCWATTSLETPTFTVPPGPSSLPSACLQVRLWPGQSRNSIPDARSSLSVRSEQKRCGHRQRRFWARIDAGEALRVAADVDPQRLPEGLLSRRAQVQLDLAWAQAQRKRDAEATLHLLHAE